MRIFLYGVMAFFSLAIAVYAAVVYGFFPLGDAVHPDMKTSFLVNRFWVYCHVFAALTALLLGPWQFSQKWRKTHPQWHRLSGKIYLSVGILIGGVSGLYLAVHAYGGLVAQSGFACLALLWLFSGFNAYRAIRRGDIAKHRVWMLRNYSLSLAAVTLRFQIPLSMLAGFPYDTAYPIIAWLCWLPNILLLEWWQQRRDTSTSVIAAQA